MVRVASLLVAALPLLACSPLASAARPWAPVHADVRAWVDAHAIAVGDPAAALDLGPLCDAIAGAPVIGLGESSHGVHELKVAELAAIRCIAERPGPGTILFEVAPELGRSLDAYVQGETTAPDLGAGDLVGTEELRETLDWIRAHNHGVAAEERVRLGGLDIFCWERCMDAVGGYVASVDPSAAPTIEGHFDALRSPEVDPASDRGARGRAALDQIDAFLVDHRARFEDAQGPASWAEAAHQVALVRATLNEAFGPFYLRDRDRAMADNALWIRDRLRPGEVLILIAHSGHVAADRQLLPNGRPSPPSMGEHLRHRLGRGYVAVHMTFESGSFMAHRAGRLRGEEAGHRNPLAVYAAPEPAEGTLEALLGGQGAAIVVDLRSLPAEGAAARWFNWEHHARGLGASWRRSHARWPLEEIGWARLVPALAFDLVVQVPRATPLTPL
ncbi:MAG: erythromycin esterase family protein [Myxococcales bacterium]|nr:erythromycin esterase family protein [Myxococcales bacterium]